MMNSTTGCFVCAHSDIQFLVNKKGYQIHKCMQCGHGWVSSLVKPEELEKFYTSSEYKATLYDYPEKTVLKAAKKNLEYLERACRRGMLLDVGCGRGTYLAAARRHGWTIAGVDASPDARKWCQEQQVPVYESLEALEGKMGPAAADAASLWEVIEHLPHPRQMLVQIRALLKQKGVLALSTPNFASLEASLDEKNWGQLLPPMHLHYFTPKSLEILLTQAGFEVLEMTTSGTWHPGVDRILNSFGNIFKLPEKMIFLLKVVCYKTGKYYFDRTLHKKRQGRGLFCLARRKIDA